MPAQLPANATWFTFTSGGAFSVYAFTGREEANKPFEFSIELVSRSANENLTDLLGTPGVLSITDRSGTARHVHGLIREMEQLHTANAFTHYRCILVPRLWYLDKIRDHRIFQHISVVEIIQKILNEQGFDGNSVAFNLFYTYEPREYCVQYGETDLHFISRLCEEEGIYFYFEHSENGHTLCFCDREGGPEIPGESDLRFYPGSGHAADTAVVSRLNWKTRVNSNAATYREWNFEKPRLDLEMGDSEPDASKAPAPKGMLLEQYQYPHLYQLQKTGSRYVTLQLLRQLTFASWIEIESDASRFLPGHAFGIHEHPRSGMNAKWWVVNAEHEGKQPGVLEHESPDERGLHYRAKVTAIPATTRFIPELEHPKNPVPGQQTAIVTGLPGEEIFTDKYSRVKVKFHWDRLGARDENSSCWVRVSAGWAGDGFGAIHIPRVGQEVLVDYLEGDPDRPVVTGRAYYTENMPPWHLPGQKALSGIQSREVEGSRRNQLVMDDTTGQIQTQVSSDHQLSQLNLGYITRISHMEGRSGFRGEGFELRTDGWGVLRSAKGMVLTTNARKDAGSHVKDFSELVDTLAHAVDQHAKQSNLSVEHKAQSADADKTPLQNDLEAQLNAIKGSGESHGELGNPQIVLSSPVGIASTTPGVTHLHSGKNMMATSGRHFSVAAGHDFLVSALRKVSIFAHKAGIKLFAGRGKVEIQAQSDGLDLVAEQELRVFSTKERVHISAPKEIMLTAGGSYILISEGGIEIGTKGNTTVKTSSFDIKGPASKPYIPLTLPRADLELEPQAGTMKITLASAMNGPAYANEPYILYEDGVAVGKGVTDQKGVLSFERNPEAKEYAVGLSNGRKITYNMVEKLPDGEEGAIQRALQQGFQFYENTSEGVDKVKGLKEHLASVTGIVK